MCYYVYRLLSLIIQLNCPSLPFLATNPLRSLPYVASFYSLKASDSFHHYSRVPFPSSSHVSSFLSFIHSHLCYVFLGICIQIVI